MYQPLICAPVIWQLKGNGVFGQVKTLPEILHIYRAYLLKIVHSIVAPDTLSKDVERLLEVSLYSHDFSHYVYAFWQYT
jgi:hypothetical protein